MKFLRAMLFYVLFYLCDLFMLRLRPCFRPHGCIDHGLLHDRASEAPGSGHVILRRWTSP